MEHQEIGVSYDINGFMRKEQNAEEFRSFEGVTLRKMTDKELAAWQSGYEPGSPQYIIADHEWQRRLMIDQIKATRFAAYMGILGAAVGAIITWITTKL